MKERAYNNVDEYLAQFPNEVQTMLRQLRHTIAREAPDAIELISYGMPAFKLKKVLVYFAAYKGHIGFYPTASGIEKFKNELGQYKSSKGAIQFALDKPLPLELITRIVRFRVQEVCQTPKK